MLTRILLLLCVAALGGCTRYAETRISSTGIIGVENNGFILAPLDGAGAPEIGIARDRVVALLNEKGFRQNDAGPYYLEVGVAARPAEIAILETRSPPASAKPKRSSKKCQIQEYRIAVALTRIADGAELYRGSAAEYRCKPDLAAIVPLLVTQALADQALADFGNPRGVYVVKSRVN
jgi:hypothetical protein